MLAYRAELQNTMEMDADMDDLSGRYTYEIRQDEFPDNDPREWSNLGTMAFVGRWDHLGDKGGLKRLWAMVNEAHKRFTRADWDLYCDAETDSVGAYLFVKYNLGIILPITLNERMGDCYAGDQGDCLDIGQRPEGYIFATWAAVRQEYGGVNRRIKLWVEDRLRSEVTAYSQYLTGDVWGYTITDRYTGELIESCWGFFGYNYCEESAQEVLEALEKEDMAESVDLVDPDMYEDLPF